MARGVGRELLFWARYEHPYLFNHPNVSCMMAALAALAWVALAPKLHTPLYLILPKDKYRTRTVAAFVEHVRQNVPAIGQENARLLHGAPTRET